MLQVARSEGGIEMGAEKEEKSEPELDHDFDSFYLYVVKMEPKSYLVVVKI